jgi:hypothetical protein
VSTRKYTLELTAEELRSWEEAEGGDSLDLKLIALAKQAKADRERDDLRLPWQAVEDIDGGYPWRVVPDRSHKVAVERGHLNERQAKLMSAAPELLEAVQALQVWAASKGLPALFETTAGVAFDKDVMRLVRAALRKVETGVPE